MDTKTLTAEERNEVAGFAAAFMTKEEILLITGLDDCQEIDDVMVVEQLKQIARIRNIIFGLAENKSADALKQALKIIDSANMAKV
ncbi:hypothetical protein [Emticicia fontis]